MKFMMALILMWQVSAFATEKSAKETSKKITRKVAREQKGVCAQQAKQVVEGIAKGLKQDAVAEQVVLLETRGNLEIYNVKLKGNGFLSEETSKYWMVQLFDLGDGCGFKSISLEDAAG